MGQYLRVSQNNNKQTNNTLIEMKQILVLCLSILSIVSCAPQYSDQTGDLGDNLEIVSDIFGDVSGITHSGVQPGNVADVEVAVEVVRNEDGYVAPDDYDSRPGDLIDKATTTVDQVFQKCEDYADQGYDCVPYYQCHNGSIITDGGGLIDIRNGFGILSPEDSKCEGFLDVCCLDPDFEAPPPTPIKQYTPKCGQRHHNGLGVRIQGFKEGESQFGEWPHMCAVLSEEPISEADSGYTQQQEVEDTVNLYQCGGSLIAPDTILTAAHCVGKFKENPGSLKVRCGEWDTQDQNEPRPHQDRYVTYLDIHPAFNDKNLANDWALLYTAQPFQLEEHIDTVCLPSPGDQFEEQTCFATGWGKDKFGAAGQYQVVLKEIDLPVVGHDQCEAKLRTTRLGKRFQLDDSFICAGGVDGKDTCKGDGGSPLVCQSKFDPTSYVQAGIVAWGIGCGEDNTPGVYASVSQATCWIDQAITCHYGGGNSYFGYTSNVCQVWLQDKITDLTTKRDAAGKFGRIFQSMIDSYNQCTVTWEQPSAPLVDISEFSRDSAGYPNVEGSEGQEVAGESY